jgi:uncharacterized protein (TIGR03067 family)
MRCLLLALLVPLPLADDEPARHQGTWSVTSSIRDGQEAPADLVGSIRRIVDGDHVTWTRDGKNFAGTKVVYDVTKSPHAIDLIPDGGPNRDEHILGIYKLEGETLTICVADAGQPRPTGFEAAAGSKRTLQAFRRIKAATPAKAEDRKTLDQAMLQASWRPESALNGGSPMLVDTAGTLVIAGDRWLWFRGGERTSDQEFRFEINPTQTPPAIDLISPTGRTKGQRRLGIYRLEGDSFTIGFGSPDDPRPVAFESKAARKQAIWTFKRIKP